MSETASELARKMNVIEEGNRLMTTIRLGQIPASFVSVASIATAQNLLKLLQARQDAELIDWKLFQAKWIAQRGCDGKKDLFLPLPSLGWKRPPPDLLGPRPLSREKKDEPLHIKLWNDGLISFAVVEKSPQKGLSHALGKNWNARYESWTGIL